MNEKKLERLGIFGGSFDPVHYAHLLLAESCREQCELDEVWLLPAAAAPHKKGKGATSSKHRVEMLKLAVGGHEPMQVSRLETDRGGVSYTFETLETLHEQHPETTLFFLMGADMLEDLPNWREPQRVCELAIPVAVRRPGSPEPAYEALKKLVSPERLEEFRKYQVDMPLIDLTSTDLRSRIAAGKSIRYRTPRAVEKYIETARLYRG